LKNVIIFGPMGAGKDEIANILADEYGYMIYKLGKYIREDCDKRNYKALDKRKLYQDYGQFNRQLFGDDVWNEALHTDITAQYEIYQELDGRQLNFVIADGRQLNELGYWSGKGFVTLGVYANEDLRAIRLIKRDGKDQSKYFKHDTELQAIDCFKQCQWQIWNDGTREELHKDVLWFAKEKLLKE
jgi:dephospho-CoA kinase